MCGIYSTAKMPIASCGSLYTSKLTHRFEMRLPWKRTSAAYSLIDEITESDYVVCGVYKPLHSLNGKCMSIIYEEFETWLILSLILFPFTFYYGLLN